MVQETVKSHQQPGTYAATPSLRCLPHRRHSHSVRRLMRSLCSSSSNSSCICRHHMTCASLPTASAAQAYSPIWCVLLRQGDRTACVRWCYYRLLATITPSRRPSGHSSWYCPGGTGCCAWCWDVSEPVSTAAAAHCCCCCRRLCCCCCRCLCCFSLTPLPSVCSPSRRPSGAAADKHRTGTDIFCVLGDGPAACPRRPLVSSNIKI